MSNKIKVLCHSIWYPLSMSRYFEKAFRHREDLDFKTVGPYTGSFIPWIGGMNLPIKYAIPPDFDVPYGNNVGEYNYEVAMARMGDWKPDLIVQIDAGVHFKYKPVSGMTVTVGTDPHVLNEFYETPRKYSDKFFNMQASYSKEGDIYLPYAYSQYDHFPDDTVSRDTDAVLIGMPYENRVQWVNELRRRGVSVIFENGPVFDEARALYNRGRIGLNWSSLDDLTARAFEVPAMKLAPVFNIVSDIGRFFDQGIHYEGFSNLEQAVERVVWLKEHPVQCNEMAEASYNKVQGQTYDARVEQILKECGFIV